MGSGGMRIGSGKKPKSLENKKLDGKSAKIIAMNGDFSKVKCDIPKGVSFLKAEQADGSVIEAAAIYENVYKWLHTVGCDKLVPTELVVKYSWLYARFMHCENCVTEGGYIVECNPNGAKQINPNFKMGESYSKQADATWMLIYTIVRENASAEFTNNVNDQMEKLLRGNSR